MGQDLPVTAYALLGLLTLRSPLTGYELQQLAGDTMRFYWTAPAMSQVYSELRRLEREGLVTPSGTGRGRRFSASDAGVDALRRWAREAAPDFPVLKHQVALRLMTGGLVDDVESRAMVAHYLTDLAAATEDLRAVRRFLATDEQPGGRYRYPAIVADWGLTFFAAEHDAARRSLRRLDGLATRRIVGITGPPGAGKTTLAARFVDEHPGAVVVPMDGFHLADVVLAAHGSLDRKGTPETFDALGYAALLRRLREDVGETVYAPGFERDLEQPLAGAIEVPPTCRTIVAEGNYLLLDRPEWHAVTEQLDEVWYVDVPAEERRRRLVERHVAFGKTPEEAAAWVDRVDLPNGVMVERTRERADRVLTS